MYLKVYDFNLPVSACSLPCNVHMYMHTIVISLSYIFNESYAYVMCTLPMLFNGLRVQ